jgi:hypothetical protein
MSKPYRPSNGTEGEGFEGQWCEKCTRDAGFRENPDSADGCPILANVMIFNVDEAGYPKEWIQDDDGGNPRCTAFAPESPRREASQ